ncbi:MAG: hypothetical protein PHU94_05115, partial [Bacilli bacterium]|nr:hypothetical protein [Bacilli bacterium]
EHKYDTQGSGIPDTLAIDESNNPVIIEYKLEQDSNVLVQGLSYFSWLEKNSKHFELLVHEKINKDIKVNWDNPRIILIARGFDNRTISAVKAVDNVELYKYVPYNQDIFYLENIYNPNGGQILKEKRIIENTDKVYDINYHIGDLNKEIQKIFYNLQEQVKLLPGVEEVINQKSGITYRTTKSFSRFEFGRSYIRVLVKDYKYNDLKNLVRDITSFKWGYKGEIKINSIKETNDVFELIKQSYESTL